MLSYAGLGRRVSSENGHVHFYKTLAPAVVTALRLVILSDQNDSLHQSRGQEQIWA